MTTNWGQPGFNQHAGQASVHVRQRSSSNADAAANVLPVMSLPPIRPSYPIPEFGYAFAGAAEQSRAVTLPVNCGCAREEQEIAD